MKAKKLNSKYKFAKSLSEMELRNLATIVKKIQVKNKRDPPLRRISHNFRSIKELKKKKLPLFNILYQNFIKIKNI